MSLRGYSLALAALFALASVPALAQPAERDHRGPHGPPPPPPPPGMMATAEPPPPQAENPGAKAGFEWVGGHWDWKAGKWAWKPGHWEREHTGKHWKPGRWEKQDKGWAFVEGEWIVVGEPPPAGPPGPPPPPPPGGHREWHIDRPVVSSMWPMRGKPGAHVIIHGRNFPPDWIAMLRGEPIPGSHAGPQGFEIAFDVPPGATTGEIAIGKPHLGHNLPVGQFEVVTTGDPEAEWRKLEQERERAAEAAWVARQKELAKDRAAREAAWRKQEEEWERTREERREKRAEEIRAKWQAAFLADADTQAELTLHAERVATLERAKEIAEVKSDGKLAVRIDIAFGKENARHDQRMALLQTNFGKGGTP